jgi:hypothetical protein
MSLAAAVTHVAFADESNWNQGRYRSISLISAALDDARLAHRELAVLRTRFGKSEFKWQTTSPKHGIALVDFHVARLERLRADVLIWDIEDSRHKNLPDRDDKANFARMYYHLLHNVLRRRWPNGGRWLICPDEQKEVDWLALEQCLGWRSWVSEEKLFALNSDSLALREFYNIDEIRPVSSHEYLLVQLADLFAGLAVYSYNAFDKYRYWKDQANPTPWLFAESECGIQNVKLSNRDRKRLPILGHVRHAAGVRSLQISLESTKGLSSRNPNNGLNFWLYTPQRPEDRAPTTVG